MRLACLIAPAFALAPLTVANSAEPAAAPAAATPPAAAPAPAKPKKLCRRTVDTGSIVAHSTCHTSAEWQAIDAQNSDSAERFSNSQHSSGGLGSH